MALAAVRNTLRQDNAPHPGTLTLPVEAATTIWQGGMVCVNAAGNAVPAAATAGFSSVLGRAEETVVNAGAAGAANVEVVAGVYRYDNSGASIADANRYTQCYAVDDEAVHLSNAGGRPLAGTIVDVDALGVWVSISGLMTSAGSSAVVAGSGPILKCRGASTANIANLATFTVANDGITLAEDDRFFVKDQAAGATNGVYVVGVVAVGVAPLTRALDADDGAELSASTLVTVSEGTANADSAWELTNDGAIVVGTTVQVWAQTPFGFGAAGAMVNQTIAASDAGTVFTAARIDHNHNFPTANAAQIDCDTTAAGAGAAATFAASDHQHAIAAPGNAAQVDCDTTAAAAGVATTFARADHVHGIVAPGNGAQVDCDTTAAGPGVATTFARADHVHGIVAPGNGAQVDCDTTAAGPGVATTFARADHVHGIVAPGNGAQIDCALTAAGPGVAVTFARADHIHAIQAPVAAADTSTLAAAGASTVFATANHVHAEHYHEVRYVMTTDVPNLAAFVFTQDGVVGADDDLVLLANQTAADENGVYVLTNTAATSELVRVGWMPAGATIRPGYTIHVEEGTLFAETTWFAHVTTEIVIGTDAHVWYPECVTQSVALVAGTTTLANIPILSVTRTGIVITRRIANTTAATITYAASVGGANGITAGPVGTGAVVIEACIANGTINNVDISTMNLTVLNR